MKKSALLNLMFCLLSVAGVQAQDIRTSGSAAIVDSFKTLIKEKMQSAHLVGVGAALVINDSVVWKEGFGYADKENRIPFTTSTAMVIGSVTKTFTAMGVMQLHEKHLLNVDDPLTKYLPQFSIKTRRFSIHDIKVKSLINHTSGLPRDYIFNIWKTDEKYTNTISNIKNEYTAFPANMVFHYSNVGYSLLGHTIFKVSGLDYPAYIRKSILQPTGMDNSGFMGYSPLKNISKTYDTTGVYTPLKIGNDIPAGALFSTIDDMVKYAREIAAIYNGKKGGLLKPETIRLVGESGISNIENINYALGWCVFKNDSCLLISHFGSYQLTNTVIAIDLKRKNAFVLFANTVGGMELNGEVMAKFQEFSGVTPADYIQQQPQEESLVAAVSAEKQREHAGMYVNNDQVNTVKAENGKLVLDSPYGKFLLNPVSNDEFIPGIPVTADSVRWLGKSRFIFSEVKGYRLLFWQDANRKRQLMGHLVVPEKVGDVWIKRLGTYIPNNFKMEGWEQYFKLVLSQADNGLLQLKAFCSSGEYVYYLRVENDNELIICGFGETGGETISFGKTDGKSSLKYMGIPFRKISKS